MGIESPVRSRPPGRYAAARYIQSIARETYLFHFVLLLVVFWVLFSIALYFAEQRAPEPTISTFGEALYWGIAAFSTAGIANMPSSGLSLLIGGIWIVAGSAIFFGIIIATITGYFMRPLQRPANQIVETIEYNLDHLQDLSVEELDLLKDTADALILHMEHIKKNREE